MGTLLKLTLRELAFRKTRFLLALLAIVATCCMIVWFIGSFDILKNAAKNDVKNYFGDYQVIITKSGRGNMPESLVAELRADSKNVVRADRAFQTSCNAARGLSETAGLDKIRAIMGTPQSNPVIMGMEMEVSPFDVDEGVWFKPVAAGGDVDAECLLNTSAKAMFQQARGAKPEDMERATAPVELGELVDVNTGAGNFKLKIVGFLKQGVNVSGLSTQGGGGRRQPPPPQNQQQNQQSQRQGRGEGQGSPSAVTSAASQDARPAPPVSGKTAAAPEAARAETAPAADEKKPLEETSENNVTSANIAIPAGVTPPAPPQTSPMGPGGRGGVSLTSAAVYVPLEVARKIAGDAAGCNILYIQLQGIPVKEFREKWEQKCKLENIDVAFFDTVTMMESIDARDSADTILRQAQGAIGLVVLAALLIIFTTLSMGVNERTRQLAILRTLGFTKGQIAGLIMMEGALLGVFGWAGGLLAGWLMLQVIVAMNAGMEVGGVALSSLTIIVALVTSLVGAMLASILPAWRATRVAPLDALAQNRTLPPQKGIVIAGLIGAALLFLVWVMVYIWPLEVKVGGKDVTMSVNLFTAVAFLLMAPLAVVIVEKLLGPVMARLLGMNPAFLANELSSNKWRTLGTTLSLCIGLGLYSMIQIWGYSMLGPFTPTKDVPNTLVGFFPSGIPNSEVAAVMEVPGVILDDFMPLAIEQPNVAQSIIDAAAAAKGEPASGGGGMGGQMNNVVLFGVDPQIAFRKKNPTVTVKFLEGSREATLRALCDYEERACVIPDTTAARFNLKVGDKLALVVPESARGQDRGGPGGPGGFGGMRGGRPGTDGAAGGRPGAGPRPADSAAESKENAENTPSGDVSAAVSPAQDSGASTDGTHTPPAAASAEGGRPGGMAPGGEGSRSGGGPGMGGGRGGRGGGGGFSGGPGGGGADGDSDHIVEYKIVGIVEIPGWHWITKTTGVRTQSGRTGGMVFAAYDNVKSDFNLTRNRFFWMNTVPGTKYDVLESHFQEIASRSGSVETLTEADNTHQSRAAAGVTQGFVKVSTYESLMASIGRRSESVIQQMARMPLIILIITTLAVMNTMMASVRTRRWEMGILRAYGVTRGGLVRLIFAEALLIGICACVLCFGFGAFAAACTIKGVSGFGGFLAGITPALVIPWSKLGFGFGIALGVCIIAAIIPAIRAGREEPASLLVRKE